MEAQNLNEVKAQYVQKIEEVTPLLSAIKSLAFGKALNEEKTQTVREFKSMQDYLDSPLNTPAENQLKKIFAAAVVVAHQKGILKLPEGYAHAESVASIVDEGLTRIKTAYQIAEGKINPIDADAAINDRLAIRTTATVDVVVNKLTQKASEYVNIAEQKVMSVSDKLVKMGIGRLSDVVCAAAVKVFPPAAVVVPYVKRFVTFITPVAQRVVRKGIKMVADFARTTIKKVASTAKTLAKKVINFFFA